MSKDAPKDRSSAKTPEIVEDHEIVDNEKEDKGLQDRTALVPFDPLQRYLMEISKYPMLSREEEDELALKFVQDRKSVV